MITKAEKLFFSINLLVWTSYGLMLTFDPTVLATLGVFDQSDWVEKVEVRAMYGGAQLAFGLLAVLVFFNPTQHKLTATLFYALLFGGLALVRMAGLMVDGPGLALELNGTDPVSYNSGALWFFEVPMFVFASWLCWRQKQTV